MPAVLGSRLVVWRRIVLASPRLLFAAAQIRSQRLGEALVARRAFGLPGRGEARGGGHGADNPIVRPCASASARRARSTGSISRAKCLARMSWPLSASLS
jgi:hypothetical protein